jgi:hypothetical protein
MIFVILGCLLAIAICVLAISGAVQELQDDDERTDDFIKILDQQRGGEIGKLRSEVKTFDNNLIRVNWGTVALASKAFPGKSADEVIEIGQMAVKVVQKKSGKKPVKVTVKK